MFSALLHALAQAPGLLKRGATMALGAPVAGVADGAASGDVLPELGAAPPKLPASLGDPTKIAPPSFRTPPFVPTSEFAQAPSPLRRLDPVPLSDAQPATKLDPRQMPAHPDVPGLYGGPPRPYTPQTAAEYEYAMARPNSIDADPHKEGLQTHNWKSRLKSAVVPALLGAAAGGKSGSGWGVLGGAAAGGTMGAANPTMGRQMEYQMMYQPSDDAAVQRANQQQATQDAAERRQLENEQERVRTDVLRGSIKDSEMTRRTQDAQLRKIEAETKATEALEKQRGYLNGRTIQYVDPATGQPVTAIMTPYGLMPVGGNVSAYNNQQTNQTRRDIAGQNNATSLTRTEMQQSGATARTGMQQAGANSRAATKPGTASAKVFPASKIARFAQEKGISEAEARQRITSQGYTIK